ncbi:MAG: CvpA family protein [Lachnospiraceae bacterium]|nr:CvpA family protein [Lachnospiraceae bacterium]MBQ9605892.1 CvpA family protein [Lachnospiraceae bacterium]MBR1523991.1 CvpA family protein [Lachnospiraceae bacterium]
MINPDALFLIIVAILLVCFFAGRRAGLIRTLIPVVSAFASFGLLAVALPVLREDVMGAVTVFDINSAIVDIVAFAVTFLLLRWLIKAILKLFRVIGDAPVLGSVNRMLGGIVGFLGGLMIVWSAFFFILLLYGPDGLPQFYNAIGQNEFVKLLYNNNLITTFVNFFVFVS